MATQLNSYLSRPCNYLAEDIGHRKNVIRSKIAPSSSQVPGQRFLDKSRSAV